MTVGASSKGDGTRPAIAARPPPLQRLRYNLRIAASQPTTLVGILMAALFAYLIVVPIVSMLLSCVRVQLGDERRIRPMSAASPGTTSSGPSLARRASLFWEPLVNTLSWRSAPSSPMSSAAPLAWLLARTDMFGRKWFATA